MREELLGYLLDALEPHERAHVETKLANSPELQGELAILSRALEPLVGGGGHHDPPGGLAERCCQYVTQRSQVVTPASLDIRPSELPPRHSRWTLADMVVAAGIVLAAGMIFFPAVSHSRYAARLAACQNNLRQIGTSLVQYSGLNDGFFPAVPSHGNLSAAGVYGPTLTEKQILKDHSTLVCPASDLATRADKFRVPTMAELQKAQGAELTRLQQAMGGSYGYHLGYVSNGENRPTKNLGRSNFALMADAPQVQRTGQQSPNHGGIGENVLFEDGHVVYQTTPTTRGGADNIYLNDRGQVAPGLHKDDSVIAGSGAPLTAVAGGRDTSRSR